MSSEHLLQSNSTSRVQINMATHPVPNIPAIYADENDYWTVRSALQADEKSLCFTAGFVSTPTEAKAAAIVSALKAHEKEALYGKLDDSGSFIEHAHQVSLR